MTNKTTGTNTGSNTGKSASSKISDSGNSDDMQRNELRKRLRFARDQIDEKTVARYSKAIHQLAWPLIERAKHVAGYLALGREVDLSTLLTQCRIKGQSTYVPLVHSGHQMVFAPIDDSTQFARNRYGIQEPVVIDSLHQSAHSLDAVLVPLVGFDNQCNRMGMGGGYYDRCFAHRIDNTAGVHCKPLLIGVAFEQQCVDSVFPDWWDVPLDHVVTEQRVINRSRPSC